jgi:dTDP-4-amino-4,6-dideoxyglucose formyltransferase
VSASSIPGSAKVLVVTDNVYLYQKFLALSNTIPLAKFTFACSSSRSPVAKHGVEPLRLTVEPEKVARTFDVVISLHCKQLFPSELVLGTRCINVHPGLNPHNRGWYPQVFSIINKMPLGATIHEIDEEIDHGPIIDQEAVPLFAWDTSMTAYNRVVEAELRLLRKNLPAIVRGDYEVRIPPSEGNLNLKADFVDICKLDLNQPASFGEVIDRLRALSHGDYRNAYFLTEGSRKVFVNIELEPESESQGEL